MVIAPFNPANRVILGSWVLALVIFGWINFGNDVEEFNSNAYLSQTVRLENVNPKTASPEYETYSGPTVGFYLHVFDYPAAVIHQVRQLKKYFPESPIYIMSDGGNRFDGLCNQLGCKFQLCPPANDRWNPWPFLHRIHEATLELGTEYVVMLEPDNTVHGPITHPMFTDAGGMHDNNPPFTPKLVDYITQEVRKQNPDYKWKYTQSGLAGGSYFRSQAILDAFSDEAVASINWTHMMYLDHKRVMSSDFAMPIALAMKGYDYQPWDDSICVDMRDQPNVTKFAFEHYLRGVEGGKPEYRRKIETWEEETMFAGGLSSFRKTHPNQTFHAATKCQLCWNVTEYYETFGSYQCTNPLPVHAYTQEERAYWFKRR